MKTGLLLALCIILGVCGLPDVPARAGTTLPKHAAKPAGVQQGAIGGQAKPPPRISGTVLRRMR